jgi:hypothetical protein
MIASILIILSCAATVAVQSPSQLSPRPMTSDAIVAAIGTDADARDVTGTSQTVGTGIKPRVCARHQISAQLVAVAEQG